MDAIWLLNFFLVYFVYRLNRSRICVFFSEHVTFSLVSSHDLLLSVPSPPLVYEYEAIRRNGNSSILLFDTDGILPYALKLMPMRKT